MLRLLQVYLQICVLRKGPQDLPASKFLLQFCIVLYLVSGSVLLATEMSWLQSLMQAATEAGMLGLFLFALLRIFEKSARFVQTATAAYGCGAVMTVLTLPVLFWAQSLQQANQNIEMASFLLLGMLAWSFVILGHILRLALDRARFTGMALAFFYMILSYQIMFRVFPPA